MTTEEKLNQALDLAQRDRMRVLCQLNGIQESEELKVPIALPLNDWPNSFPGYYAAAVLQIKIGMKAKNYTRCLGYDVRVKESSLPFPVIELIATCAP